MAKGKLFEPYVAGPMARSFTYITRENHRKVTQSFIKKNGERKKKERKKIETEFMVAC